MDLQDLSSIWRCRRQLWLQISMPGVSMEAEASVVGLPQSLGSGMGYNGNQSLRGPAWVVGA
jgi:hypothetical protein